MDFAEDDTQVLGAISIKKILSCLKNNFQYNPR